MRWTGFKTTASSFRLLVSNNFYHVLRFSIVYTCDFSEPLFFHSCVCIRWHCFRVLHVVRLCVSVRVDVSVISMVCIDGFSFHKTFVANASSQLMRFLV